MIKRVLALLDTAPSRSAALSVAASIAGISKAELVGAFIEDELRFQRIPFSTALAGNILGEPMTPELIPPDEMLAEETRVEDERRQASLALQEQLQRSSIRGRFVHRRGSPKQIVAELAATADLVVVPNTGRHLGVEMLEDGLTTNAILHSTTRPVFVVPEEAAGDSCLVIAFDSSAAAERTLRAAAELATIVDTDEVHLVTVCADADEGRRLQLRALEYLSAYELDVTARVLSGHPRETIVNYCRDVEASIVALGAFGTNRILERIFGGTAEHVLHKLDAAVLLMS